MAEYARRKSEYGNVDPGRPSTNLLNRCANTNHRCSALIVEDDEELLEVLADQLMHQRFTVYCAATASQAIEIARFRHPALIILDVFLLEGDGFQIVEVLQQEPSVRHTPLLIYTAHDLSRGQRSRLALGPTRYLIKSRASDAEFLSCVHELLEGR